MKKMLFAGFVALFTITSVMTVKGSANKIKASRGLQFQYRVSTDSVPGSPAQNWPSQKPSDTLNNPQRNTMPAGTPGNPGNPNMRGTPVVPGTPAVPGTPGNPGNPGVPGTPGSPSSPGVPNTPGSPSNPGNTTTPGNPSAPGVPR